MRYLMLLTVLAGPSMALAGQPAAGDETTDWLLGKATTAPSTRPVDAAEAVSPFAAKADTESRKGKVTLNSGTSISGMIATTREKPIRVWDAKDKEYRDIPFSLIQKLEAKVIWEREEKEWHFKNSGSDIKEYSGKTYPARELQYVVTLVNGQSVTGGIVAPLYLKEGDNTQLLVLNKRQKGEIDTKLKDLPYVAKVELE